MQLKSLAAAEGQNLSGSEAPVLASEDQRDSVDATEFAEEVRALIGRADLDDHIERNPALSGRMLARAARVAERAYGGREPGALYQLHKALYWLYEDNVRSSGACSAPNQFNPVLIGLRNALERRWERFELGRITLDSDAIPTDPEAFCTHFKRLCADHPVGGHPLFEFLEQDAERGDLVSFFLSDAAVIVRFCDLVVLSMVGVEDDIRPELAENFWDEMGRGRFQERHVHLYRKLLEYAGVNLPGETLTPDDFAGHLNWQGLAGYNLYLFLCLHRRNQFRSLGALGAAEMMDPSQYSKVLAGCRRVGLRDDERLTYYKGHEEMDVAHGDGWLKNVLVPLLRKYPEKRHEIIEGALIRMNLALDYYDDLLKTLASGRSAGGAAPLAEHDAAAE